MISKLSRQLSFPCCHDDMDGYSREELLKNRKESEALMAAFNREKHPIGFCHVTFGSELPRIEMLAVALPENQLLTPKEFEAVALKLLNRTFTGYLDNFERVEISERAGLVKTVARGLTAERQIKLGHYPLSQLSF
jgi:hypothetical protein